MTPQELMKPRYKVMADYPKSDFTVGEIVEFKDEDPIGKRPVFNIYDHEGWTSLAPYFFEEYPHLFKKLEWWEERKLDDMPEYVKDNVGGIGRLGERYSHNLKNCVMVTYPNGDCVVSHLDNFEPATESEYNDYIKSKQSA